MLPDEVRKRLQRLNRARLDPSGQARREKGGTPPPPRAPVADFTSAPPTPKPVELSDITSGDVIERGDGAFLLISRRLKELMRDADDFLSAYCGCFTKGSGSPPEEAPPTPTEVLQSRPKEILHPDMLTFLDTDPFRVAYLDIETAGLSGAPVFLTGLMHFTGADFTIKQLFARNYAEERSMLDYLSDLITDFDTIVSFNGKAFDMPFIRDRSFANAVRFTHEPAHVDLLHEARRRWKGYLPNCKLQTLETFICRRRRSGDIPGDQIPQAYHDFVRTGNAHQIKRILHHNALDLITMAEIMLFMFRGNDDELKLIF